MSAVERDVVDASVRETQFGVGVGLVGLALCALPIGLLAIGGGPCAGPRNIVGSLLLLGVGAFAVGGTAYGAFRIFQNLKLASGWARLLGLASILGGFPIALVGGFYLVIGVLSLSAYLGY
jgi:hypothetical protein